MAAGIQIHFAAYKNVHAALFSPTLERFEVEAAQTLVLGVAK